jgi:hypothetical protein
LSAGVEYYGNLGPIARGFVPIRKEEQYLYEVVNLLAVERFELNGSRSAARRFDRRIRTCVRVTERKVAHGTFEVAA